MPETAHAGTGPRDPEEAHAALDAYLAVEELARATARIADGPAAPARLHAQEDWRRSYFEVMRLLQPGDSVETAAYRIGRTEDHLTISPLSRSRR